MTSLSGIAHISPRRFVVSFGGDLQAKPAPPPAQEPVAACDEYTKQAIAWLTSIEDGEALRNRCRIAEVRPAIASRLGMAPGYLENLRRGRILTPISARDFAALKGAYIAELQQQIADMQEMIAQSGQASAAESQLAKAKAILEGEVT